MNDGPRTASPAESALMLPALRGALRLGWFHQMSPASAEVPWHQKRLDLAWITTDGDLIAVELKVEKWKKAVEQAYLNRWASDASWVGIWHRHVSARTCRRAHEAGVGLIAVTSRSIYPIVFPSPAPETARVGDVRQAVIETGTRVRDLLGAVRDESLA